MSKNNPKNKMEAFAYQFQDTIKILPSLALLNKKSEYDKQIELLKKQIEIYEQQTGL
jgi:hypothetical protein